MVPAASLTAALSWTVCPTWGEAVVGDTSTDATTTSGSDEPPQAAMLIAMESSEATPLALVDRMRRVIDYPGIECDRRGVSAADRQSSSPAPQRPPEAPDSDRRASPTLSGPHPFPMTPFPLNKERAVVRFRELFTGEHRQCALESRET